MVCVFILKVLSVQNVCNEPFIILCGYIFVFQLTPVYIA